MINTPRYRYTRTYIGNTRILWVRKIKRVERIRSAEGDHVGLVVEKSTGKYHLRFAQAIGDTHHLHLPRHFVGTRNLQDRDLADRVFQQPPLAGPFDESIGDFIFRLNARLVNTSPLFSGSCRHTKVAIVFVDTELVQQISRNATNGSS